MHHRPADPRLTARVFGAFTRWGLLFRALLRVRTGRLVLAGVVTTAVTALMLVLPVVSGLGSGATQPLALDSSSSTTSSPSVEEGTPVLMGVDGRPIASSSFPGAAAPTTTGETTEPAPGTSEATAPTSEPAVVPDVPVTTAAGSSADPSTASSSRTRASGTPSSSAPSAGSPSSGSPSSEPTVPAGPGPDPVEPAPVPSEGPAAVDAEGELLALLDEARAGCDPLTVDRSLTVAARAHSAAMRDAGALVPLEGGPAGSIAQGGTDAHDVLAGWLADPTGRATIEDCSRDSVGIGLVEGGDGPWWSLLLA